MSLPPVFPVAFYRLLVKGAQKLGISRVKLATDSLRHYLKAQKAKSAPAAKALPKGVAEHLSKASRKFAKDWWDKLPEAEKKARAKKANQARWKKKQ